MALTKIASFFTSCLPHFRTRRLTCACDHSVCGRPTQLVAQGPLGSPNMVHRPVRREEMRYLRAKATALRSSTRQSLVSPMMGSMKLLPCGWGETQTRLICLRHSRPFILPWVYRGKRGRWYSGAILLLLQSPYDLLVWQDKGKLVHFIRVQSFPSPLITRQQTLYLVYLVIFPSQSSRRLLRHTLISSPQCWTIPKQQALC